nr:hypothetical protein [Tanacetum cinerariifolium]
MTWHVKATPDTLPCSEGFTWILYAIYKAAPVEPWCVNFPLRSFVAKEATGKKRDEAAFSGDNEAYAPKFNQFRTDMMTITTMHKAHSRSYRILLLQKQH